jgi:hypothetical protein
LLVDNGFDVNRDCEKSKASLTSVMREISPAGIRMLLKNGAIIDVERVREWLTSPFGLDKEFKSLRDELTDISSLNHEELVDFLSRVKALLNMRDFRRWSYRPDRLL